MKKLIITLSLVFISGISSAQIAIDSIKAFWSGNMIDSIYLEYTSHIPQIDTVLYNNFHLDGVVRMHLSFIGCSTAVAIQNDTTLHFFNDSIFVSTLGGLRFSTVWNVSSICNLPTSPVIANITTLFPIITSIEEVEKLENKLSIYPNPVRDVFSIKMEEGIQINRLELLDIQGRLVKNYQNNKDNLPIHSIAGGVYFVKITTSKGIVLKKIVVD